MNPDFVFEVSYEVCNKVGGIYAVLKSKAAYMTSRYGDGYYAIGYYDPAKARVDFDEEKAPEDVTEIFKKLESEGIRCYYGRWLISGRPRTILVDSINYSRKINEIKTRLWEDYKVDSINSDQWFNDPVLWSHAVGILIEELAKTKHMKNKKIVAHFHEWLAGTALLYLKKKKVAVATVFTTHATMLGRTIAGTGGDLYKMVNDGLSRNEKAGIELARRYGVIDKHTMEVSCARNADVFTTVSDITGKEADYILGVKPDILLPNGLDLNKFPEIEELSILRRKYRNQTRKFLTAYFSRYYSMDYYKIRSMFISGRYEFHNKGIDVFIDALGKLNSKLKEEKSETSVVAFLLIPAANRGENIEILKNISLYEEILEQIEESLPEIGERITEYIINGKVPDGVLTDEFRQQCKKLMVHFTEKKGQTPPLCAFELSYPQDQDPILQALKKNGLLNKEDDKVKVIFYPAYLSSSDRFISLEYNQATLTCDIGVFPSFYEPWGYTPLETAAQATLAVTTDLAGFGQFIEGKGDGIKVLKVDNRPYDKIVEELYKTLYEIVKMPKKELTEKRINAKELSRLADWSILVENYFKAHAMATKET
ncbi:MAG: glycogen/starch synthase [Candidatus Altiarchaeota archaeon]|nr:glycogen/starch synthase [Candidatus Altiarchaeota archaeon]